MESERDPELIHYTEYQFGRPGGPFEAEWTTYRREVGRLLAEGHEGKFVLIKGGEIIGLFDTYDDARAEEGCRYRLGPHLIYQLREWERPLRIRSRCGWIA